MEEEILKSEEKVNYIKGGMKVGTLILTNSRIIFTGTQFHIKEREGSLGDRLDKALNINQFSEEEFINLSLEDTTVEIARHGFTKVILLRDKEGKRYKLGVQKSTRFEWLNALQDAKN